MRAWRAAILIFCMTLPLLPYAAEAKRHARVSHGPHTVGENDPRYAALIMNPQTGEIYYSRNMDAERYPASLTKMMTLYLLFEDLQAKKVRMNTELEVSDYASTMPRTNLSLQPGDQLPVETAIKALIVLSANDAAIVVAENLEGSVDKFAGRMTATAHRLGMSNTVFHNPNGLPNDAQHTTARDLAKLGIALKRDFPQYYPYFSTREFSWHGATYFTHNRVMLRYAGVDGIKTGFIGKSGFNLVTSCNRGGRPLIGVVMGGSTGAWRDNQMIALLDQGYKIIASRGQKAGDRIYAANLPTPRGGQPVASQPQQQADIGQAPAEHGADADAGSEEDDEAQGEAMPAQQPATVQQAPVQAAAIAPAAAAPKPTQAPAPEPALKKVVVTPAAVAAATAPAKTVAAPWGIQVGAFSSQALAEQAAKQAYGVASGNLQGARVSVVGGDGPVHRARLENLSEPQAKKACEILISQNSPCFIYRADAQNL